MIGLNNGPIRMAPVFNQYGFINSIQCAFLLFLDNKINKQRTVFLSILIKAFDHAFRISRFKYCSNDGKTRVYVLEINVAVLQATGIWGSMDIVVDRFELSSMLGENQLVLLIAKMMMEWYFYHPSLDVRDDIIQQHVAWQLVDIFHEYHYRYNSLNQHHRPTVHFPRLIQRFSHVVFRQIMEYDNVLTFDEE